MWGVSGDIHPPPRCHRDLRPASVSKDHIPVPGARSVSPSLHGAPSLAAELPRESQMGRSQQGVNVHRE